MKTLKFIPIVLLFGLDAAAQNGNAFKITKPLDEQFQQLPVGSVKPTGWLKEQVAENLKGFTGHLDSLAPDLIIADDIYGTNRLTKDVKSKNVGALSNDGDWQVQFLWWNSETQSNWWDGYIRTAILLNSTKDLQKIKNHVDKILATQDTDGYLGIYDKGLRYHFDNENGELWSKTTLYRGLLTWYEYTKDKNILLSVRKAVDNVIANYPIYQSHPFYSVKPDAGGLTHGLVFTDVLEQMYRLTQKREYLDYCLFLYKDFSEQVLNEDAQFKTLEDTLIALKGHGVHTSEHIRPVAAAYYASGNDQLKKALDNFLYKIEKITTPSGGPAGDEFIAGRNADATNTGYEYCSVHELMDSYIDLFAKTGQPFYGDKIEHIFFNAAQGSRHPTESAICYLKTDNAYYLMGGKNEDQSDKKQTRYRYSPVHREAAVCCVPNAGKIGPTFIQNMWMKEGNSIVATILGPCEMATTLNGNTIAIKEITDYPFDNNFRFHVQVTTPATFTLKIRKPAWAAHIHLSAAYSIENGFIVINKRWEKATTFTMRFDAAVITKQSGNEFYFMYGPLVLAHPLWATENVTKRFTVAGLKEINYSPVAPIIYQYNKNTGVKNLTKDSNNNHLLFHARLYNAQSGATDEVDLVPMFKTILRQVTFKNMR